MEPKANPICKKGQRNIHCPHYSDCLDHVVNHFWQSWSCSECPHRKKRTIDGSEYQVDEDDLYYELSPDIVRESGENEYG